MKRPTPQVPRFRDLLLLALAASLLLVAPIGIPTMWDKHEGRFFEAARGMLATGDWVVPRNLGEPLVFYPPLCAWTIAICSKLLGGLSPFVARLPGGLASVGCVLLVYEFGLLLFDRRTGLAGAVVLLTIPVWPKLSIVCQPDTPVVFLLMVSLYSVLRLERAEKRRWPWAALFWTAIAVSVLAKGPPGPVMTLAVVGTYVLWERKWSLARQLNPILGLALLALFVPPWFLMAKHAAGSGYLWAMWHEAFDMTAGGKMLMHEHASPFYYLPKLGSAAPWILFALAAAILPASTDPRERSSRRFLICWAGAILVLLSTALAKRPYYLLPIWPAVAILSASWWTRVPAWGTSASRWRERIPILLFFVAVAVAAVAPLVAPASLLAKVDVTRPILFAASGFAVIAGLFFLSLHISGKRNAAFVTLAVSLYCALAVQQTWGAWVNDVEGRKGAAFCASVRGKIGPDARLVVHHVESFVPYYLATPFEIARTPQEAAAAASGNTRLLTEKFTWKAQPELHEAWEPVEESPEEMARVVLCRPRR